MTDLLTEVGKLEVRIAECEREAKSHEEQARALRSERQECKTRLSEINAAINQAVSQKAVQSAASSAEKAQQQAEAARTESLSVLDSLKTKEAKLDALLAKLEEKKPE